MYPAGEFQVSYQPVYHAPSRSLLFYEICRSPLNTTTKVAQLRRLKIPVSGSTFAPSGTWQWSEIALTNAVYTGPSQTGISSYGKFNIVNDVGGGQAALVLHDRIGQPTYVCKIPASF